MLENIASLNHLRTFSLAAQYLSFKDAARVLSVTPTAVSHQIKALESSLRVSLFERGTRSISLTQEGEILARACQTSFSQLDQTITEIKNEKMDIGVSCCHSFAALWLTPKSTKISQLFPENPIKICASDSLIDLNFEKHIDIAIRYGDDVQQCDDELILTEEIALYKSPMFAENNGEKATLFTTQWPNNNLLPNIQWKKHISQSDFNVRTFEQEYFVLQAIMTGQGYGLLSNVLAKTAMEQNWIEKVDLVCPFDGYSYWLRMSPDRKGLGRVEKFYKWLKQEIQDAS